MPHPTFVGTVTQILFPKHGMPAESGFTIFRLEVEGRKEPITVKGHLGEVSTGQSLEVSGPLTHNTRYNSDELEVVEWSETIPQTDTGLAAYLTTFPGLGPVKSGALLRYFGAPGLIKALNENPRLLAKVKGISIEVAEGVGAAWKERAKQREVFIFCAQYKLTPYQSQQIYKRYKDHAIEVLKTNPYQLADDIDGFGFKKADEIAVKLGMSRLDTRRVAAGLIYTLKSAERDGHCFLPFAVWVESAASPQALGLNESLVESEAKGLIRGQAVVADVTLKAGPGTTPIYSLGRFFQETVVAKTIVAMLTAPRPTAAGLALLGTMAEAPDEFAGPKPAGSLFPSPAEVDTALEAVLKEQSVHLSEQQVEAVRKACNNQMSVISGLPGTGKSTSMRVAAQVLKALGRDLYLCAPTGRAAKRLSETSGEPASTIHRMLCYNPETGWGHNRRDPLPGNVVVIMDEASMCDLELLVRVLDALKPTDMLLLVGDPHQLPSVGAGNVLADLIAVEGMPHTHLDQIFRQAERSMIITNAHRINRGEKPLPEPLEGQLQDFQWYRVAGEAGAAAENCQRGLLQLVREYGEAAMETVQIITPMHDGPVGTKALNALLQDTVNPVRPGKPFLKIGDRELRLGDRVMQMKNNYRVGEQKPSEQYPAGRNGTAVFNGDLGYIVAIDEATKSCVVNVDGTGHVPYNSTDLSALYLAYAITVHKSQGSEYPTVMIPLVSSHYVMLQRTLLYTALTRAKRAAVLIGEEKALGIAVSRAEAKQRFTALTHRINIGLREAAA